MWACLLMLCLSALPALALDASTQTQLSKSQPVVLSDQEKLWIKQHPAIRVGGPQAFPPFHYYNGRNSPEGVGAEFVQRLLGELGLMVDYATAIPWPQVLEDAKERRLDLIACTAKTAERENYLLFTRPFLSFPIVIITRRDSPFVAGLDDLNGKRVALVEKVATATWLERDGIIIEPVWVPTPLDSLRAVSLGRADATVENLAAATYIIEKNGLANLKVAAPTSWDNYQLYFAVRSDWPELASILNKALAGMRPQTQSDIRNRWISVRYEYGMSFWDVVKWMSFILIPACLALLLIFLHNRSLRRQIDERLAAESKLEQTVGKLQTALLNIKTLSGLLPICASCKKIRDDQGYWQQVEKYIVQHSEAQFSHGICPDCMKKLYPEISEQLLIKDHKPSGPSHDNSA